VEADSSLDRRVVRLTVEHRAIVAACEQRDPRLAASELARHLARTGLTVIAMVDPSHDRFRFARRSRWSLPVRLGISARPEP
jgi:DNA-binding GntR family transcriptional regulator